MYVVGSGVLVARAGLLPSRLWTSGYRARYKASTVNCNYLIGAALL